MWGIADSGQLQKLRPSSKLWKTPKQILTDAQKHKKNLTHAKKQKKAKNFWPISRANFNPCTNEGTPPTLPRPPMLSTHVGTPPPVDINQKKNGQITYVSFVKGIMWLPLKRSKEIEMALGSSCWNLTWERSKYSFS